MSKHSLIELIDGYGNVPQDGDEMPRGKHFLSKSFSGRTENKRADSFYSALSKFLHGVEDLVIFTRTRSYGFMLLTFGILTVILHFGGDFFIESMQASIAAIIIGAASALLAVPLLFSHEALTTQLQITPLCRWLLYDFLCIKRPHSGEGKTGIPTYVLVVFGVSVAVVGFFVPLEYIIVGFLLAVFLLLAFQSPEFSMLSLLLTLPYYLLFPYGEYVFCALTLITVISLVRKVINGKRVFFFEQYDAVVFALMVIVAISGIIMNRGMSFSLALAILPYFAYLIGSNLITNHRMADCAMSALMLSSLPASVIAIAHFVKAIFKSEVKRFFTFGESSVFSDPAEFSSYLVVCLVFAAILIKEKRGAVRVLCSVVLAVDLIALSFAAVPVAFIISALCLAAYFIIGSSKKGGAFTILLGALLYLVYFLPDVALNFVLNGGGGVGDEIAILRLDGIEVFFDNILLGIGAGAESVKNELATRGYFLSYDFGNIFLELACESGIIAILLFAVLLVIRGRHRWIYHSYFKITRQSNYSKAMGVALFSIICSGAYCGIISEPSLNFILWFVVGAGSAMLRIAKREFDARYVYFRDQRRLDSSEIEIWIE